MDTAQDSVLVVAGGLVVLILVAIAIIVYRKVFGSALVRSDPIPSRPPADPLAEAAAEERRGNFSAAASRYEAGGDNLKAAECWEKSRDFARAAECWETGGDWTAARLHVRSGSALRAAGVYMKTKNYIEAAKIFRNKGDHLRAAQALELFGNRLAAAREYSAAGNHAHAARLLEQERMYAEAAEAYSPLLAGTTITAANADRFVTHATLLALAGEKERAAATYRRVLEAHPGHPRAISGLQKLAASRSRHRETEAAEARPSASTPPRVAPRGSGGARPPKPEIARSRGNAVGATHALAIALDEVPAPRNRGSGPAFKPPRARRGRPAQARVHPAQHDPRRAHGSALQHAPLGAGDARARRPPPRQRGPRLPDPGFDCHRHGEQRPDRTPDRIPTPVSISPEVQAGLPPDRQADIYSMGVILYELVAGRSISSGKSAPASCFPTCRPGSTS